MFGDKVQDFEVNFSALDLRLWGLGFRVLGLRVSGLRVSVGAWSHDQFV